MKDKAFPIKVWRLPNEKLKYSQVSYRNISLKWRKSKPLKGKVYDI